MLHEALYKIMEEVDNGGKFLTYEEARDLYVGAFAASRKALELLEDYRKTPGEFDSLARNVVLGWIHEAMDLVSPEYPRNGDPYLGDWTDPEEAPGWVVGGDEDPLLMPYLREFRLAAGSALRAARRAFVALRDLQHFSEYWSFAEQSLAFAQDMEQYGEARVRHLNPRKLHNSNR